MDRNYLRDIMRQQTGRVAELGTAVEVALGAKERTVDDIAAIVTAADEAKAMADTMKGMLGNLQGKDLRIATRFEQGTRKWSLACRWLADGLQGSPGLLAMGKEAYKKSAQEMAEALRVL